MQSPTAVPMKGGWSMAVCITLPFDANVIFRCPGPVGPSGLLHVLTSIAVTAAAVAARSKG